MGGGETRAHIMWRCKQAFNVQIWRVIPRGALGGGETRTYIMWHLIRGSM